jgi:[histone H3]-lysine36 N-dimethyltransferase SETMAR
MNLEMRHAVQFCVRLGETFTEILKKMQRAYGIECVSRSSVHRWVQNFQKGRQFAENIPHAGRPYTGRSDKNIALVHAALTDNPRASIRNLSAELHISHGTVHTILTEDLCLKKINSCFVPHMLTAEQKEKRVRLADELIIAADNNRDFLKQIVTGDESWCYQYEPSTKRQTAEWLPRGADRPKKVRGARSHVKTMLLAFFDAKGIIHKEFLPPGQTVNGIFYKQVMERLLHRMSRVRSDMYHTQNWQLLHDNAPCHTSVLVKDFLASQNVKVLQHPPYSPDLAPADFFLFPRLKKVLKGKRFEDVTSIKRNVVAALSKKAITEEDFNKAFNNLYTRCQLCVTKEGDYVEK